MSIRSSFDGTCTVIFDGQRAAAFDPWAMRLYRIDLSEIGSDTHYSEIPTELTSKISRLRITGDDGPMLSWADGQRDRPAIGRLTINISNNCNLWCSYCYADHGFYGSPKSLMSADIARSLAHRAVDCFSSIDVVHFFGGEPLQNPLAVEVITQTMAEAFHSGRLTKLPGFVVTTNGTLLNERILELLKTFAIEPTISIDGPAEVHDYERPLYSGKGSHALILKNVRTLRDEGVNAQFECTYSACHVRKGWSVVNLLDYFYEELDQQAMHIAPASGAEGTPGVARLSELLDPYEEAAAYSVWNLGRGQGPALGFVLGILEQLSAGTPSVSYCPAFFDQVSLSVNGDVFPCFMFIGDDRFRMGNLLVDEFPNEHSRRVIKEYREAFRYNPSGTEEWYAPLHFGCTAGDMRLSGKLSERAYEPLQRRIIERTLLELAHLDAKDQVDLTSRAMTLREKIRHEGCTVRAGNNTELITNPN